MLSLLKSSGLSPNFWISSSTHLKVGLYIGTRKSVPPPTSTSGSFISDNAGKASLLNQAFSSFFTVDPVPPVIASPDPSEVCSEDLLCTPVSRLISLPIRTSPGSGGISSLLLKSTAFSISETRAHIFNISISTGSFPSQWKQSSVIAIPKTSPLLQLPRTSILSLSSTSCLNFSKSTSLKSCWIIFSPIFFSLILNLVSSPVAPPYLLLLLLLITYFLPLIQVCLCGVFLDVKKAFDSVSHSILLSKIKSLGIHSNVFHCLSSCLNWLFSACLCQWCTFPSLSCLWCSSRLHSRSSCYFFIFINDTISSQSDHFPLQSDLDVISSWFSSNHLSVNPSKSKYMLFSLKHQSYFDSIPFLLLSNTLFDSVFF